MNKKIIMVVSPTNKFSTVTKSNLKEFTKRNTEHYEFKVVDFKDMNKSRNVFIVADKFYYIKSAVIKRLAFASYRPNGNLRTFVYTEDLGFKPIEVRDYNDVTELEYSLKDQQTLKTINVELQEYRNLTSMYYNSPFVKERFKSMFHDFENVLLCMQAEINESGFDFYSAGNPVTVEKLSVYTAPEETEFMYAGETVCHKDLRTKTQYQELALDTIRNWVQLQYYKMYDIEPDYKVEDEEFIVDVNPDWYSDGAILG